MKRENPTIEICPGITRRTVAHGDTMYQMLATLAAGSRMPAHSHEQEQIVHILEGKMRLIVEGVPHELSTGDSFYLASNVPHGVETLSATRVLDTFSPPRSRLSRDRRKGSPRSVVAIAGRESGRSKTDPAIFSARLQFAAQLFRACDGSRLVVAPLPHQLAEELLSRLV